MPWSVLDYYLLYKGSKVYTLVEGHMLKEELVGAYVDFSGNRCVVMYHEMSGSYSARPLGEIVDL
jgi:hypothetical protein